MGKINVAVFYVGEKPFMKEIDNGLEPLQEIVGGYIEFVRLPQNEDLLLICNEEGKIHGLQPQLRLENDVICGNFLIAKQDSEDVSEIASLSQDDVKRLERLLSVKL